MKSWLLKVNIRTWLIGSSIGSLMMFAALGGVSLTGIKLLDKGMHVFVDEVQPTVLLSSEVSEALLASSSALGFYLLSHEAEYREQSEAEYHKARTFLGELATLNASETLEAHQQAMVELETLLDTYRSEQQLAFKVAENPQSNMPGLRFASRLVHPLDEKIRAQFPALEGDGGNNGIGFHAYMAIAAKWHKISVGVRDYLAFRNPATMEAVQQDILFVNRKLDSAAKFHIADQGSIERLANLQRDIAQYGTYLESLLGIHGGIKWRKDTYLVRERIGPVLAEINRQLFVMREHSIELSHTKLETIENQEQQITLLIAVLVCIGMAVGLGLMVFLLQVVMKSLGKAVDAMVDIGSDGNLNVRMCESGDNEMSMLARGFNRFADRITEVIDLVSNASTSLADDARDMATTNEQTKDRVTQQQSEIAEMAAALEDMSESLDGVASNTEAAAQSTRQALDGAVEGQQVVTRSITAINQVAEEFSGIDTSVSHLAEETKSINSILAIITGISEQTNLLALNAAIEAARAGESGRGFAVVADEVRSLSQSIQVEAGNIQTKIGNLQGEAKQAVSAVQKGQEMVKQSVELSSAAGESLAEISESISTITEMNTKIAGVVTAQNQNASRISSNMSSVQAIAVEAANAAVESARSGQELSLMAGQLRGMVIQSLLAEEQPQAPASSSEKVDETPNKSESPTASEDEDDIELF